MAYIRKKSSGKYQIVVDIGTNPKNGRRMQRTKGGFDSYNKAKKAMVAFEYEIMNGIEKLHNSTTFRELADKWLDIYRHEKKISTIRIRKKEIAWLNYYIGYAKVTDINRSAIQDIWINLKERGFHKNTISGIRTCARMIFTHAEEEELIDRNPVEKTKVITDPITIEDLEQKDKKQKYMEEHQLKEFLLLVDKDPIAFDDPTAFNVLAYSGMRLGEMLALQWKHIDFVENTISIRQTLYRENNQLADYHLLTPKTVKSVRDFTMDQPTMNRLKKHQARQNQYKLASEDYNDLGFVFSHDNGYPHLIKTFRYRMKKYLSLTDFADQNFTPHSLRHTHVSLMIEYALLNNENDMSMQSIMDRVGHSDYRMVFDIYAHTTKKLKEKTSHMFSEHMRRSHEK